jgi:hypothetical protein
MQLGRLDLNEAFRFHATIGERLEQLTGKVRLKIA